MATNVLINAPMLTPAQNKLIVLPGPADFHIPALPVIAEEFGWAIETAADLQHAAATHANQPAAAVFFHREAFGPNCSWTDALCLLGTALPGARLIPCHGFSEQIDWNELSDAGAFHFLWLPLKENELRQCLGFIWQNQKQLVDLAETPMTRFPANRRTERTSKVPARNIYSAA